MSNEPVRTTTAGEVHPALAVRGDDTAMVVFEERVVTPPSSAIVLVVDTTVPFGSYNWHYTYDDLGRMTSACSDWQTGECVGNAWQYSYDGAGNLLLFDHWDAEHRQTVTSQYVINGANQIECIDDPSGNGRCDEGEYLWVYDAYGQLRNNGVTEYLYDAAGRLSSTTIAGIMTTHYAYNGDGERVSQTVDGATTTYLLDVAASSLLASTTDGQSTYFLDGLAPIAQFDGTKTLYSLYDGAGSVRMLVDSTGVVQRRQTFDPYGNLYDKTGTDPSMFGFGGGIQDTNGLMYWKGQYYSPSLGLAMRVGWAKTLPSWNERWDQAQFIRQSPYASGSDKFYANTYIGLSVAAVPLTALAVAVCSIAEPCGGLMIAGGTISGGIATAEVVAAYHGPPNQRAWARRHGAEHILFGTVTGGLTAPLVGRVYASGPLGRTVVSGFGISAGTVGTISTAYQIQEQGYATPLDYVHLGISTSTLALSSYEFQRGIMQMQSAYYARVVRELYDANIAGQYGKKGAPVMAMTEVVLPDGSRKAVVAVNYSASDLDAVKVAVEAIEKAGAIPARPDPDMPVPIKNIPGVEGHAEVDLITFVKAKFNQRVTAMGISHPTGPCTWGCGPALQAMNNRGSFIEAAWIDGYTGKTLFLSDFNYALTAPFGRTPSFYAASHLGILGPTIGLTQTITGDIYP